MTFLQFEYICTNLFVYLRDFRMSNKEHATTEYTEGQIEGSARNRAAEHIDVLENRPKDMGGIKYAILTLQQHFFLHTMTPLHSNASFSPLHSKASFQSLFISRLMSHCRRYADA